MLPTQRRIMLVFILVLVSVAIYFNQTTETSKGLDIQGGIRMVLEAKPTDKVKEIDQKVMSSLIAVVRNRVDGLGVGEPTIQQKGKNQIIVEIPSVKDPEEAVKIIGDTAALKFKEPKLDPKTGQPVQEKTMDGKFENVWIDTPLDGQMVTDARPMPQGAGWVVSITFNSEGGKLFGELTSKLVGRPIGIELDDKIISAPNVNEAITGGSCVISGGFDSKGAQSLAIKLKAGQFPVPLEMVENRTVGATLGEDAIDKSMFVGALGLGAVIIFMMVFYRVPGMVANLSLLIYACLTLTAFKLIPVTFTVPGIAGFILSVGMAVDANILIFERTKEELREGRSIFKAVEAGFDRAWTSILDSNVTTLISCGVLFYFGTGLIKGFALTLGIGVIFSMFTAVTVTRTFIRTIITFKKFKNPKLFGIKPKAKSSTPVTN